MWKELNDHKGYFVSDDGLLKSYKLECVYGKLRKLRDDKDGYKIVSVYDRLTNKSKVLKMHRLVAENFIDNPNNYSCVDHINGIKSDNRVNNLRWCSFGQNTRFYHNDNPGLTYRKDNDKWRARRHVNSHRVNIGTFDLKEDAIYALQEFDKKHGII